MNSSDQRRGFALILSAPSGAGKTTLARRLLRDLPGIVPSLSMTTRSPRSGEEDGVAYRFVDEKTFLNDLDQDLFLEWAEIFGNWYGTPKQDVEQILQRGEELLLEIDWQGARQVRGRMRVEDYVSVFVLPPSRQALLDRLTRRNQDAPDVVERRMAKAREEISHWVEYDYLIINDDLASAAKQFMTIVLAERLKRVRAERYARALLSKFDWKG